MSLVLLVFHVLYKFELQYCKIGIMSLGENKPLEQASKHLGYWFSFHILGMNK